jgi:hypothetical protein
MRRSRAMLLVAGCRSRPRYRPHREAAVCPAINAYRQSLVDSTPIAPPAPATDCPATLGNTDIWGLAVADPRAD